ncbi:hypothetical protein ACTFIY_003597 [Dictyostelium cf. discoideum]
MVGKSKASQKTIVKSNEIESKKVSKTIEPKSLNDGFSNSHDVVPVGKKEKGEKQLNKSKEYVLGVKGSTILIREVPKGFYETEIYKFFKQFGDIKGVRVDRTLSGKFAKCAFVRFFDAEVAKIAKEAMNGYIMFGKKLDISIMDGWVPHQSSFCPRELLLSATNIHMDSLHNASKRIKEEKDTYNQLPIESTIKLLNERINREIILKEKLKEFEIDYKFTGYLDIIKSALEPKQIEIKTTKTTPTPATTTKTVTKKIVKSK